MYRCKFTCLFFVFIFQVVVTCNLHAQTETLFRDSDEVFTGLTESQWVMFLGVESLRLQSTPSFRLSNKELYARKETLLGPTLGFARKWYLIGNLTTTLEPSIYFLQNKDQETKLPTNEAIATYKVSEYKENNQFYGIRLSQSLGYTLEFQKFNIEPYAQFFIGQGFGRTKIHYHWDTHIASEHEQYDTTIDESITHQGLAAGLQIITHNGYMSYLKVSKTTLTYKKKETEIFSNDAGSSSYSKTSQKLNDNLDKLTVTLGLGYVF